MARAAAKRNPRPKQPAPGDRTHRRSDGGGRRVEDQLFFQKIRRKTKWVFIMLAVVFALSFVVAGVGSGSTGIGDLLSGNFGGIFGGGSSVGGPDLGKNQKAVAKNPKDAQAWRNLATAYSLRHQDLSQIDALEHYTKLRPKDVSALTELAGLYDSRAQLLGAEAQAAQVDAQGSQPSNFGPPPKSGLGQAFAAHPDPIAVAAAAAANQRFNDAYSLYISAVQSEVNVYKRIVGLDSSDSTSLIRYGQLAEQARDYKTALGIFQLFLTRFPDDPSASYAKQQIKALKPLAGLTQPSPTG